MSSRKGKFELNIPDSVSQNQGSEYIDYTSDNTMENRLIQEKLKLHEVEEEQKVKTNMGTAGEEIQPTPPVLVTH